MPIYRIVSVFLLVIDFQYSVAFLIVGCGLWVLWTGRAFNITLSKKQGDSSNREGIN